MLTIAILLSCGIVILSVSVHYETLRLLSRLLSNKHRWYSNRIRASLIVMGCLLVHLVEVVFFGVGFRLLDYLNEGVDLQGSDAAGLTDLYYSLVVYTSIGFGDVVPVTPALRILTAIEGLTGAILIAWTASFMFFHMGQIWDDEANEASIN